MEVEGMQIPSPTKRVRLEVIQEEEEEEMDDSALQDMDTSQLCSETKRTAITSSTLTYTPKAADVGVIEKLMLVNFMCHKRLDIILSPNVNFILGRNGSGKSAIMTAIVVALGGKTACTQRGSSLKQLIRTGCSSAEVIVHLRNRGVEAYRPDVYDRTIVVERQIRADGTGNYKIKSLKGFIVSNKKEEQISILDHCNIQIDNPVSLLNQDMSRNLLNSSNSSAKYKLFMKASHLEQIAHDYERASENQKLMKEGIMRQESMLLEYESLAKHLEEQTATFTLLEEMERKVQQLEQELQWALVMEIEKGISPIEVDIEKAKAKIPRNETRVQSAKAEVARAEGELCYANKALDEVVKEADTVHQQRNTMHTEKRTRDKTMRDAQNAIKVVEQKIKETTKEKLALEQRRSECIEMSQRDMKGEQEHRLQQLREHQEKMKNVEDQMKTAANDQRQFEHALAKNNEDIQDNRGRVGSLDARIRYSEDQLYRLQSSRSDELQVFGPLMRPLMDAVWGNQQRFLKMPKGPVGSYIRLKNYKWSTAIEQVLKNVLFCFVVDNPYDDAEFKRLANGVFGRGSHSGNTPHVDTIISSFQDQVYDVSRNKPCCPHTTVLDMMDVADVDVLNTLIDQCSVESILLIEQRSEANHVIEHQRIHGVISAYTLDGDQILPNRHYSNKRGKLGIIRASVDDAIRSEEANLDTLIIERVHLTRKGSELRDQAAKNKHRLKEVRDWILKKEQQKNQVQMDIQELQTAEEEEESQEDIATYDGEIQECEARIAELEQRRELKEEEAHHLKDKQLEFERSIQQFEAEVERVTEKIEKLQANHNQVTQAKQSALAHLKHLKDRMKEIMDIITDLETKLEEQRLRADEATQAASKVCDRIDTQRTRKSIRTEISKLKQKLQQETLSSCRREESEAVKQKYLETMELFQKTTESIKKEEKALVLLQRSLRHRVSCYQEFRSRINVRACMYFTHLLGQRGYHGKLCFNHEKQRLEIQINVDVHSDNSQSTKNTKSLSGGERSYATVCFIMSLWEAMEAPFRCLDEFDVFMDMMNRSISMRLMLECAADQPNRQFIFFTPQDMSSIDAEIRKNVKVKVLCLNEPERGQTTLDFTLV